MDLKIELPFWLQAEEAGEVANTSLDDFPTLDISLEGVGVQDDDDPHPDWEYVSTAADGIVQVPPALGTIKDIESFLAHAYKEPPDRATVVNWPWVDGRDAWQRTLERILIEKYETQLYMTNPAEQALFNSAKQWAIWPNNEASVAAAKIAMHAAVKKIKYSEMLSRSTYESAVEAFTVVEVSERRKEIMHSRRTRLQTLCYPATKTTKGRIQPILEDFVSAKFAQTLKNMVDNARTLPAKEEAAYLVHAIARHNNVEPKKSKIPKFFDIFKGLQALPDAPDHFLCAIYTAIENTESLLNLCKEAYKWYPDADPALLDEITQHDTEVDLIGTPHQQEASEDPAIREMEIVLLGKYTLSRYEHAFRYMEMCKTPDDRDIDSLLDCYNKTPLSSKQATLDVMRIAAEHDRNLESTVCKAYYTALYNYSPVDFFRVAPYPNIGQIHPIVTQVNNMRESLKKRNIPLIDPSTIGYGIFQLPLNTEYKPVLIDLVISLTAFVGKVFEPPPELWAPLNGYSIRTLTVEDRNDLRIRINQFRKQEDAEPEKQITKNWGPLARLINTDEIWLPGREKGNKRRPKDWVSSLFTHESLFPLKDTLVQVEHLYEYVFPTSAPGSAVKYKIDTAEANTLRVALIYQIVTQCSFTANSFLVGAAAIGRNGLELLNEMELTNKDTAIALEAAIEFMEPEENVLSDPAWRGSLLTSKWPETWPPLVTSSVFNNNTRPDANHIRYEFTQWKFIAKQAASMTRIASENFILNWSKKKLQAYANATTLPKDDGTNGIRQLTNMIAEAGLTRYAPLSGEEAVALGIKYARLRESIHATPPQDKFRASEDLPRRVTEFGRHYAAGESAWLSVYLPCAIYFGKNLISERTAATLLKALNDLTPNMLDHGFNRMQADIKKEIGPPQLASVDDILQKYVINIPKDGTQTYVSLWRIIQSPGKYGTTLRDLNVNAYSTQMQAMIKEAMGQAGQNVDVPQTNPPGPTARASAQQIVASDEESKADPPSASAFDAPGAGAIPSGAVPERVVQSSPPPARTNEVLVELEEEVDTNPPAPTPPELNWNRSWRSELSKWLRMRDIVLGTKVVTNPNKKGPNFAKVFNTVVTKEALKEYNNGRDDVIRTRRILNGPNVETVATRKADWIYRAALLNQDVNPDFDRSIAIAAVTAFIQPLSDADKLFKQAVKLLKPVYEEEFVFDELEAAAHITDVVSKNRIFGSEEFKVKPGSDEFNARVTVMRKVARYQNREAAANEPGFAFTREWDDVSMAYTTLTRIMDQLETKVEASDAVYLIAKAAGEDDQNAEIYKFLASVCNNEISIACLREMIDRMQDQNGTKIDEETRDYIQLCVENGSSKETLEKIEELTAQIESPDGKGPSVPRFLSRVAKDDLPLTSRQSDQFDAFINSIEGIRREEEKRRPPGGITSRLANSIQLNRGNAIKESAKTNARALRSDQLRDDLAADQEKEKAASDIMNRMTMHFWAVRDTDDDKTILIARVLQKIRENSTNPQNIFVLRENSKQPLKLLEYKGVNNTPLAHWIRQRWKGRVDDANALIWAIMYPYRLILKDTIYRMIRIVAGDDAPAIITQLKGSRGDLAYFFQQLINSSGESQAASAVSDPSPSKGVGRGTAMSDQVNTPEKGSDLNIPSSKEIEDAAKRAIGAHPGKKITWGMVLDKLPEKAQADLRDSRDKGSEEWAWFKSVVLNFFSAKRSKSSDDQDAEATPAKRPRKRDDKSVPGDGDGREAADATAEAAPSGEPSTSRVPPTTGGRGNATPAADTFVRINESREGAEGQSDHGEEDHGSLPAVDSRGAASAEAGREESRSPPHYAGQEDDSRSDGVPGQRRIESRDQYEVQSPSNRKIDIFVNDEPQPVAAMQRSDNDIGFGHEHADIQAVRAAEMQDDADLNFGDVPVAVNDKSDDEEPGGAAAVQTDEDIPLPKNALEIIEGAIEAGKEKAAEYAESTAERKANRAYRIYAALEKLYDTFYTVNSKNQLVEWTTENIIKVINRAPNSPQVKELRTALFNIVLMGKLEGLEFKYHQSTLSAVRPKTQ